MHNILIDHQIELLDLYGINVWYNIFCFLKQNDTSVISSFLFYLLSINVIISNVRTFLTDDGIKHFCKLFNLWVVTIKMLFAETTTGDNVVVLTILIQWKTKYYVIKRVFSMPRICNQIRWYVQAMLHTLLFFHIIVRKVVLIHFRHSDLHSHAVLCVQIISLLSLKWWARIQQSIRHYWKLFLSNILMTHQCRNVNALLCYIKSFLYS